MRGKKVKRIESKTLPLQGGEAVEGREGGEAVVGEVEGGERGEGEPGAEGRPVEEGDTLPRHLIIICRGEVK